MTTRQDKPDHAPDVEHVIAEAVRDIARMSDMPVAFGGQVDRGGRSFVVTQLSGTVTHSLMRLRVCLGQGLGGKALAMARPVTVQDYEVAQGITHLYDRAVLPEKLHAMMAMPIQVNNTTRAVLYLAIRKRMSLGDRLLEHVAPVLRRLERDLVIEDELQRRLSALPSADQQQTSALPGAQQSAEAIELQAELAAIAESTADDAARERLLKLCERMKLMSSQAIDESAGPIRLAPREREVLSFVAIGCTNDDIAGRLGLLPNTVKAYVKTAIRKLGVKNRFQAAHRARQLGLLEPPRS